MIILKITGGALLSVELFSIQAMPTMTCFISSVEEVMTHLFHYSNETLLNIKQIYNEPATRYYINFQDVKSCTMADEKLYFLLPTSSKLAIDFLIGLESWIQHNTHIDYVFYESSNENIFQHPKENMKNYFDAHSIKKTLITKLLAENIVKKLNTHQYEQVISVFNQALNNYKLMDIPSEGSFAKYLLSLKSSLDLSHENCTNTLNYFPESSGVMQSLMFGGNIKNNNDTDETAVHEKCRICM